MKSVYRKAAACALAAAVGSLIAYGDANEYTLPADGIRIRECTYDKYGMFVSFETALPPPYVVGVFRADELGLSRVYPIRYKITSDKAASIMGDFFMKKNTFVQVFTESVTNNPNFRELRADEVSDYFNTVQNPLTTKRVASRVDDIWSEHFAAQHPELISNNTWVCFFPTNIPTIMLGLTGTYHPKQPHEEWRAHPWKHPRAKCRLRPDGESDEIEIYRNWTWRENRGESFVVDSPTSHFVGRNVRYYQSITNLIGQQFLIPRTGVLTWVPSDVEPWDSDTQAVVSNIPKRAYGPYDTSVGCGYRVTFHDDTSTFDVERAISARADRSQEVVLRRPFRSLSAHDGIKVTVDWRGELTYAVETNAVPDRIYWEGIRE